MSYKHITINERCCIVEYLNLGLTIPDGGVCMVNSETNRQKVIDDIDYEENINGVAFFSKKIYNITF